MPASLLSPYMYFISLPAGDEKAGATASFVERVRLFEERRSPASAKKRPYDSISGTIKSPTPSTKRVASIISPLKSADKPDPNPFISRHVTAQDGLSAQDLPKTAASPLIPTDQSPEVITKPPFKIGSETPKFLLEPTPPTFEPNTAQHTKQSDKACQTDEGCIESPQESLPTHEHVKALTTVLADLENKVQQYSNTIHNLRNLLARFSDHSKEASLKPGNTSYSPMPVTSAYPPERTTTANPLREILGRMPDEDVKVFVRLAMLTRSA